MNFSKYFHRYIKLENPSNNNNSLKLLKKLLKYNVFCFQNFSKNFCEYITMENLDNKNENNERNSRKYVK